MNSKDKRDLLQHYILEEGKQGKKRFIDPIDRVKNRDEEIKEEITKEDVEDNEKITTFIYKGDCEDDEELEDEDNYEQVQMSPEEYFDENPGMLLDAVNGHATILNNIISQLQDICTLTVLHENKLHRYKVITLVSSLVAIASLVLSIISLLLKR